MQIECAVVNLKTLVCFKRHNHITVLGNMLTCCNIASAYHNLVRSAYRSNLISVSGGLIGFSLSEGTSLQVTLLRSYVLAWKLTLVLKKDQGNQNICRKLG